MSELAIAHGASLPDELDLSQPLATALRRAAAPSSTSTALNPDIRYILSDGTDYSQSYGQLLHDAEAIAQQLTALHAPHTPIILNLSHGPALITALWACWLADCCPVPLTPPPSYTTDQPQLKPLRHAVTTLPHAAIITDPHAAADLHARLRFWDIAAVPVLTLTVSPLALTCPQPVAGSPPEHPSTSDLPDLLLFTSGSTGTPKGVMLSRSNIWTSTYGMAIANHLSHQDILLNWMPLEHVASLVMFHLTPVVLGCPQIHVANDRILQQPTRWLELMDRHRVTATWAPNFAYGLIAEQMEAARDSNSARPTWELSCVRWMGNGAEAVVGSTTQRFVQQLAPYGLAPDVVSPGYGMTETCSGILHAPQVSLVSIASGDRPDNADNSAADAIQTDALVSVGTPIPGISVRIVDEQQQVVTEDTVGQLQVKGATVTSGYYQRPDLTAASITADGWFDTGDLAMVHRGQLIITGRKKDSIIINGVNYASHDIETVVEQLDGVVTAMTAACAVRPGDSTTDALAIFWVPEQADALASLSTLSDRNEPNEHSEALIALLRRIRVQVVQQVGVNPRYLVPVTADQIPKTSIGKIQRSRLSQQFAEGAFDAIVQQVAEGFNAYPEVSTAASPSSSAGSPGASAEIEGAIATAWATVLPDRQNPADIRHHDNFFELGGSSIALMQVLQALHTQGYTTLTVVDLFQYPTVASLARHIATAAAATEQSYSPAQSVRRSRSGHGDIAVVGLACRLPGAPTIDDFWHNLRDGVESITVFSDEELLASGLPPELIHHPDYVPASPVLQDIEQFDADFFGYSPKEAELLDPQHRLLLECAWESLETAGYNPLTYAGAIGLYAGASMNTYLLNHVHPNRHQFDPNDPLTVFTLSSLGGFQATIANDKDYLTTRVSYKLNLRGPSVNVQTACSTSLVAIHMAAQSILQGECDMALAGGVSVETPQTVGHLFQPGMILSPDGHCRAFDAQAQGTIFGSGAGVVVLKRLENALADQDTIYAVIKGSAMGNDGGMKVGYFAPRSQGQTTVAREALAIANIPADTLQYVEAHGTGTALGDPIEIAGLTDAFRATTPQTQFCGIGSVKTNLGHLNSASGVVGFIKTVLALHHKTLPPSLHFHQPNPQIDFAQSPFYVQATCAPWPTPADTPRRAGVNSLGIGGTNVHVILEEAPSVVPSTHNPPSGQSSDKDRQDQSYLLPLSAQTPAGLQALVQRYADDVAAAPDLAPAQTRSLANIGFTAAVGRSHFEARAAFVATSVPELQTQLGQWLSQPQPSPPATTGAYFWFTGQGSQYPAMGRRLYDTQPVFRQTLDQCDAILRSHLDRPLLELLYGQPLANPDQTKTHPIHQTQYTQPALFAIEYAIAQVWMSWGIQPRGVMGHSIGEYVAACVARVFSLEDALALVAARGRLMQALPPGDMVSVQASVEEVNEAIAPHCTAVSIAAINGPDRLVLSGESPSLATVVQHLTDNGIPTQALTVSHAFHSPMMEAMQADFRAIAQAVTFHPPRLPLISNLTGELIPNPSSPASHRPPITADINTADYWVAHVRQPVQFATSVHTAQHLGWHTIIECGPHPVLIGMAKAMVDPTLQREDSTPCYLPSLRRPSSAHPGNSSDPELGTLLTSLGHMYQRGNAIAWENVYARGNLSASSESAPTRPDAQSNALPYRRIPLPTYPFQRQRHWLEPIHRVAVEQLQRSPQAQSQRSQSPSAQPIHPLLGHRHASPLATQTFEHQWSLMTLPFMADHRLAVEGATGQDRSIVPGMAYVETLLAACRQYQATASMSLRHIHIPHPLVLETDHSVAIQTLLTPNASGAQLQVFSTVDPANPDAWQLHCEGTLTPEPAPRPAPRPLNALQQQCPRHQSAQEHYRQCGDRGLHYGPTFQGIRQLWIGDRECLAHIDSAALSSLSSTTSASTYGLHPALLDACCQGILALLPPALGAIAYVPMAIDEVQWFNATAQEATPSSQTQLWSYIRLRSPTPTDTAQPPELITADVEIMTARGEAIAHLIGISAQRFTPSPSPPNPWHSWLYQPKWQAVGPVQPPNLQHLPQHLSQPGHWIVFADEGGVAEAIALTLTRHHHTCTLIYVNSDESSADKASTDSAFPAPAQPDGVTTLTINPQQPDSITTALDQTPTNGYPLHGIVYLWALRSSLSSLAEVEDKTTDQMESAMATAYRPLLSVVQAAVARSLETQGPNSSDQPSAFSFIVATQNSQRIHNADAVAVGQSPISGLMRSLHLEQPTLRSVHVDVDATLSAESISHALLSHGITSQPEPHIAVRSTANGPTVFCPRLHRLSLPRNANPAPTGAIASIPNHTLTLQVAQRGTFEHLHWQSHPRTAPADHEIELQVDATGLNFRDVLNVLDLYPGDPGPLGMEVAGTVVAVGADVSQVSIGDRVVAIASASFSQYVTVTADLVAPCPRAISAAAAATLPVTFLTAHYALHELGQIQAGDRVLIHAAAGGVGLAAVQIAQRASAEVFATASPSKWDTLRAMGVVHIMNSRTLEFADAVRSHTNGRGVDLVLNSLSGDFITASVEVMAAGGRFLEIGKAGIWSRDRMAQQRPDVSYHVIDLMDVTQKNPQRIQAMLRTLMPQFASNTLHPLPHQVFASPMDTGGTPTVPIAAFRTMQQAKHIGKIVITPPPLAAVEPSSGPSLGPIIRAEGAYLITGGLGALGLHVARWLIEQGARHLLLLGRRSPTEATQQQLQQLGQDGAIIQYLQVDVADAIALENAIAPYLQLSPAHAMPPLKGVFHLAGVLDDGAIQQQTWARCHQVLTPKALGAWTLHCLTQSLDLDLFVLFSSAASLLGSAGQANYAAANAVLDAIAHHRHTLGLPALSINWGAWAGAGLADHATVQRRLRQSGMDLIDPEQGLEVLAALLEAQQSNQQSKSLTDTNPTAAPGVQISVLPVDWQQWQAQHPPLPLIADVSAELSCPSLQPQYPSAQASTSRVMSRADASAKGIEWGAIAPDQRRPTLYAHLQQQVATVLGVAVDVVESDPTIGFTDLGIDSLTSVELRNRLQASVGCSLSATVIYDYPTLHKLTDYLTTLLWPKPDTPTPAPLPAAATREASDNALLQSVQALSEAEAEAALRQALEDMDPLL